VNAVRGITRRVDIVWRRGGMVVSRTNNTSPNMMDGAIYTNTYMSDVSLLSTTDDGIEYQCEVVINTSPPVMATGNILLDVIGEKVQ